MSLLEDRVAELEMRVILLEQIIDELKKDINPMYELDIDTGEWNKIE